VLKIALPNKGSLAEPAAEIMRDAGFRQRSEMKDLMLADLANDVEFYYLRPRDIAIYVGMGELDLGITGRDLLLDSNAQAHELLSLGFGKSLFRFAQSAELGTENMTEETLLSGKRIATAYPGLLRRYLSERKVDAQVVPLDGAVEGAIKLGVADCIADVVSTGVTLRQAGLATFGEVILESEALLISSPRIEEDPQVDLIVRRLSSVVIARQYVLVDYDVEKSHLEEACRITPGLESPTISPLQNPEWVAVRAMVSRTLVHKIMDQLYNLGARGILVTDIHACRL
jgi:ATP phosphoribosyltransferase